MKNTMKRIAEILNWLFTPIPEAYEYMDFSGVLGYYF